MSGNSFNSSRLSPVQVVPRIQCFSLHSISSFVGIILPTWELSSWLIYVLRSSLQRYLRRNSRTLGLISKHQRQVYFVGRGNEILRQPLLPRLRCVFFAFASGLYFSLIVCKIQFSYEGIFLKRCKWTLIDRLNIIHFSQSGNLLFHSVFFFCGK